MKIVLAGATGFIGRALRGKLLSAGYEVIVLTRRRGGGNTRTGTLVAWDGSYPEFSKKDNKDCSDFHGVEIDRYWDGRTSGDWDACLDGADAVINLAGENIGAKRWTPARKQEIVSSRTDATRAIVNAIAKARRKPLVLINASAVGYYGDVPDTILTEASAAGGGFLADTCKKWEAEARRAELSGTRVVLARLGPVLGDNGGMLSKMLQPFQCCLGAPLGTGRQWISWVHRDDVIDIFLFLLGRNDLSGPVNITAPMPATMQEFCSALAKALHRPCWSPIPGFFLKRVLGEMATLLLSSQKVLPEKMIRVGYRFRYASLSEALEAILEKRT